MINPDDMPANNPPIPPDDDVMKYQSVKIVSVEMIRAARVAIIGQLVNELLNEMPDADFIEVRAIRYDKKEQK